MYISGMDLLRQLCMLPQGQRTGLLRQLYVLPQGERTGLLRQLYVLPQGQRTGLLSCTCCHREKGQVCSAVHAATGTKDRSAQTAVRAATGRKDRSAQLYVLPQGERTGLLSCTRCHREKGQVCSAVHAATGRKQDKSAQTIAHAATQRQKLQIKLAFPSGHRVIAPDQPVLALIL